MEEPQEVSYELGLVRDVAHVGGGAGTLPACLSERAKGSLQGLGFPPPLLSVHKPLLLSASLISHLSALSIWPSGCQATSTSLPI